MDPLEMENIIGIVTRQIEDLTYRVYKLEDSVAELYAYAEEQKEEGIDA
jgi:2',3'-cyclic-nucleotide 2'-phosphodiesterase (5'-nucleotidase family)